MSNDLGQDLYPKFIIGNVFHQEMLGGIYNIHKIHDELYECVLPYNKKALAAFVGNVYSNVLLVATFFPEKQVPYRAFVVIVDPTIAYKAECIKRVVEMSDPDSIKKVQSLFRSRLKVA